MRMKLVLASLSPRRLQLLNQVGVECEIRGAEVDERLDPSKTPAENAETLALKKARAVAPHAGGAAVLAADTLVVAGGRVLGKPRDEEEAQRMLMTLQGGWHEVVTGYALVLPDETERSGSAVTRVCFAKMTPGAVRRYIREYRPMDKAGAYGIQGGAGRFVRSIEGPYDNVMGLPMGLVARMLREARAV